MMITDAQCVVNGEIGGYGPGVKDTLVKEGFLDARCRILPGVRVDIAERAIPRDPYSRATVRGKSCIVFTFSQGGRKRTVVSLRAPEMHVLFFI